MTSSLPERAASWEASPFDHPRLTGSDHPEIKLGLCSSLVLLEMTLSSIWLEALALGWSGGEAWVRTDFSLGLPTIPEHLVTPLSKYSCHSAGRAPRREEISTLPFPALPESLEPSCSTG